MKAEKWRGLGLFLVLLVAVCVKLEVALESIKGRFDINDINLIAVSFRCMVIVFM